MKKKAQEPSFVTTKNILIFLLGLATIAVGFILMAQPPVNGFLSRTLAPVLLVIAYVVVIPYAIIARDKKETVSQGD